MSNADKPFRTGRTAQKRLQKKQEKAIVEQQNVEKQRLAESTSDVEKRVFSAKGGKRGRSLLIATSPTGTGGARTLGGGA